MAPYWPWKKQGGEMKRRSHYNPSEEQREHFRLHFLNLWRLDYCHLKTMSWDSKSRERGDIPPRARFRLLPNVCGFLFSCSGRPPEPPQLFINNQNHLQDDSEEAEVSEELVSLGARAERTRSI